MRKHEEVIRAWLDGKTIQRYNAFDDVWVSSVNQWLNPKYFYEFEWRVKPELKQVDYQALIDSELLVSFYDKVGKHKSSFVIGKLKSYGETRCIDHKGNYWDCIAFKEDLRQVVSASALKKLILGGFDVQEILPYSESHEEDEQVVVILKGIQEGYTL